MVLPALIIEWMLTVFIVLIVLTVFWNIIRGKINLATVLNETTGPNEPKKVSLSRLQMLIFTLLISGLYLTLSLSSGQLIDIPMNVVALLGVSGGSYVLSKGIQVYKNINSNNDNDNNNNNNNSANNNIGH